MVHNEFNMKIDFNTIDFNTFDKVIKNKNG
jgi:hypothetical protein